MLRQDREQRRRVTRPDGDMPAGVRFLNAVSLSTNPWAVAEPSLQPKSGDRRQAQRTSICGETPLRHRTGRS
jgi:hypothetical protein